MHTHDRYGAAVQHAVGVVRQPYHDVSHYIIKLSVSLYHIILYKWSNRQHIIISDSISTTYRQKCRPIADTYKIIQSYTVCGMQYTVHGMQLQDAVNLWQPAWESRGALIGVGCLEHRVTRPDVVGVSCRMHWHLNDTETEAWSIRAAYGTRILLSAASAAAEPDPVTDGITPSAP